MGYPSITQEGSMGGAYVAAVPEAEVSFDTSAGHDHDGANSKSIAGGTGDLLADGSVPLTANWDVGAFTITGTQFISDIAIGTAPLGVTSTTVVANLNADQVDGKHIISATTAAEGLSELAIASEVNTGTDATRAVTPDALAGSNFGIRYLQATVFDYTTDVATGDGKWYIHIPPALNGMNLVYCHAEVITAGTTGTSDFQVHNLTDTADILSTVLTIDTAETGSDTAATPYVINGAADDVATNDVLRLDCDAVSTTAPKGLVFTLGFQLP